MSFVGCATTSQPAKWKHKAAQRISYQQDTGAQGAASLPHAAAQRWRRWSSFHSQSYVCAGITHTYAVRTRIQHAGGLRRPTQESHLILCFSLQLPLLLNGLQLRQLLQLNFQTIDLSDRHLCTQCGHDGCLNSYGVLCASLFSTHRATAAVKAGRGHTITNVVFSIEHQRSHGKPGLQNCTQVWQQLHLILILLCPSSHLKQATDQPEYTNNALSRLSCPVLTACAAGCPVLGPCTAGCPCCRTEL